MCRFGHFLKRNQSRGKGRTAATLIQTSELLGHEPTGREWLRAAPACGRA